MLNPLLSLSVYIAEMLIAYVFFSNMFERRVSLQKCLLFGGCFFAIASLLNLLFGNNSAINGLSTIVVTLLFALTCFQCTFLQGVFHTVILVVLNTALETVVISVSALVTGCDFLDYNSNVLLFLFEAICCKSLYYLLVLMVARIKNHKSRSFHIPLTFLIYPITSTFCFFIFWHVCAQPECTRSIQLLLAIASGCLFGSSIFLFVTYTHQVEKDIETMRVKSELSRLQTEQSYYQILDQQNTQLMIFAHDAKKHLAAVNALSNDPRIENYVEKLSKELADYTHSCHSGNKLLDVIIHKYTVDCKLRGIRFEYDVKLCNLTQLEDMDLVAILGNLLDNAVAAAEASSEKWITLNTVCRNNYSVIILSNSCNTPPKHNGNNLITTKRDTSFHGFGVKSVKSTIRKYQGDLEWSYDDGSNIFTVTVMVAKEDNAVSLRDK